MKSNKISSSLDDRFQIKEKKKQSETGSGIISAKIFTRGQNDEILFYLELYF